MDWIGRIVKALWRNFISPLLNDEMKLRYLEQHFAENWCLFSVLVSCSQYHFLHKAAFAAKLCREAIMTTDNIGNKMAFLKGVSDSSQTNLEKEFMVIQENLKTFLYVHNVYFIIPCSWMNAC